VCCAGPDRVLCVLQDAPRAAARMRRCASGSSTAWYAARAVYYSTPFHRPRLTPLLTTNTPPSSIFLSIHHPLSLPHAHTRHYQLGSEEQALAYLRKMICAIKEDRDPGVQVLLAISLWACPDVKTPFAVLCRDALQSEVRTMGSKQQINAWASDNTNGMIKEILSHDVCVHKYTRHTHAPTHTHTHTHAHTHTCSHTHAH